MDDMKEGQWMMPFSGESDPLPQQVSPHATTSTPAMSAALDLLPSIHPIKDVLLDLGCGDGRIVNFAAKKYGLKAFGVDLSDELLAEANEAAKAGQVEHLVTFLKCSFLDDSFQFSLPWPVSPTEWNGPTIITSYLTPKALRLLEPKIVAYVRRAKEQGNIDVKVVTLVYGFNQWKPECENGSLAAAVYDFRDDSLRIKDKTKTTNKDTEGFLPAFG